MATISDELAAKLTAAFNQSTIDIANQDALLNGTGNVTITLGNGTKKSVASWALMQQQTTGKASLSSDNLFTGSQKSAAGWIANAPNGTANATFGYQDKDNVRIRIGGTGDGSSAKFSIQYPGDAIKFSVDSLGAVTCAGGLSSGGNSSIAGTLNVTGNSSFRAGIEVYGPQPFIDFHFNNSTADYTHRLIADTSERILCTSNFRVGKDFASNGSGGFGGTVSCTASDAFVGMPASDAVNPANNTILQAPRWISAFKGRGADSSGASARFSAFLEESVGNGHRGIMQLQGYGASVQYWQFQSDGAIWNSARGFVQWQGTSDANYKEEITETDGSESLNNIRRMDLVKFIYKDDEQRRIRRGVIAQQIQEIDPEYVHVSKGDFEQPAKTDSDGNVIEPAKRVTIEKLVLDSNPLLLDALSAIKLLDQKLTEANKIIADLSAKINK